jgi:S-adenosylmethionine:tRNA ribosyltransferase-isomerase
MKTSDFNYHLPPELIAQTPLENRLGSRLLKVSKHSKELEDRQFIDLPSFLNKGDVLVLNDSAVVPARLFGVKTDTQAVIEVLLLKPLGLKSYETLVKKARKIEVGTKISIGEGQLILTCTKVLEAGIRHFSMEYEGDFYHLLDRLGEMPLPPYIHEKLDDQDRYQTVYAKHKGSSAAPTAGLHFTMPFLESLMAQGIIVTAITLHVGLGTFRPVKVDDVHAHKMHEETYLISEETALILNQAKQEKRRIIAVGTTVMRTLETEMTKRNSFTKTEDISELFIFPGFQFKAVDGLITNFHLPQSTLLMLVSAFASKDIIFNAYHHAIKEKYRFFSFGDAMIIL